MGKYSQFNEDEYITAVFDEIGEGNKILADIGARLEGSNSAALIKIGWTGTLVDVDEATCKVLEQTFRSCKVINTKATIENINDLVPNGTRFLSIDIDSCDWWVWANLRQRPELVVVETNPLPGVFVAYYGCKQKDKDGYGMSVEASRVLGIAKGYDYIGRTAANTFFVRSDIKCKYRLPDIDVHLGKKCGTLNNVF
jgi:hypothetical protein